jgi:carboxypeptidase Taq
VTHSGELGDALAALRAQAIEVRRAEATGAVLYWDDRLARPAGSAHWRAQQRAAHATFVHQVATSDELARAIDAVAALDAGNPEARAMRADLDRLRRVPATLWSERQAAASHARSAWAAARSGTATMQEWLGQLGRVVQCQQAIVEEVGYEHEPYEACLAEWEPGAQVDAVHDLVAGATRALAPLRAAVDAIVDREQLRGILHEPHGADVLAGIERAAVVALGFDLERGVVAVSERAFCLVLGPDDVRMASRMRATPGLVGIHSTLHETGHALYAQSFARLGVPATLADAPGLGIDEAQSRLVENAIGRDRPWLAWCARQLGREDALDDLHLASVLCEHPDQRLGADEATYDAHILLRMELERAIINGDLYVGELPDAWAAQAQQLLGRAPTTPLDGCLQDVHWSLGQWGYFPTYTLGNIYGAQLMARAREEIGRDRIDAALEQDGGSPALEAWLDSRVRQHGRAASGAQLVAQATGAAPAIDAHVALVVERVSAGLEHAA